MLCPHCGANNGDDAPSCVQCGYKFRFGHAYNDPQKGTLIGGSKSDSTRRKLSRYLIAIFGLLILGFVVWSSLATR
jgi:hypothetical protein